jgi:predicted homoserine dehydrogenase-like protein
MLRDVAQGDIVKWDDVALDETSAVVKLRRLQDQWSG